MARLVLPPDSRKLLFGFLKEKKKAKTIPELAKQLNVSPSVLKKWMYGGLTIPATIIPNSLLGKLEVIEEKPDNWGTVKGGLGGGLQKLRITQKEKMLEASRAGGRAAALKLRAWIKRHPTEHGRAISNSKIRKQQVLTEKREVQHRHFFRPNEVYFDLANVEYSRNDIFRNIELPARLTPLLAEEMGIHLGDGTLSTKKYYFSVRGSILEKGYYTDFVLPLYKELFNISPSFLWRPPICGFELSSKAVYTFKSKILNLPIGNKVERLSVPDAILKSRDKNITTSFIRGVFDTDGCFYYVKNRNYPRLTISIKSSELISGIASLLEKMGYFPTIYNKYTLTLNGYPMLDKWVSEIGSHNPKHTNRIQVALDNAPIV